jgi:8-oxo-dGTP diphosphatase
VDTATRQVLLETESIDPSDALEWRHRAETIAWIRSGADIFRRAKPATPPQHLVSYCVVLDAAKAAVLLVDHIDAGLWLPPGGHVEPGEHPRDAVVREAGEELALDVPRAAVRPPLFVSVEETIGRTAGHTDVSLWYVVEATAGTQFEPDPTEFHAVEWWTVDRIKDADASTLGPHLHRFVRKLALAP